MAYITTRLEWHDVNDLGLSTKKEVTKYFRSLGKEVSYSGNRGVFYVKTHINK